MKRSTFRRMLILHSILFLVFSLQIGFAQTDIPAGDVSGTWCAADSPYHVNGEITIPDDSTLIIEPGVQVIFTGYYKMNVQGRLLAVGTAEDTILFTAQNQRTGWHSICFVSTPSANDSSKIIYCRLQYGRATGDFPDNCGGAIIFSGFSKCIISNCLITNNYADYVGGGIVMGYGSSPVICNNIISNNFAPWGGGMAAVSNCNPFISNNIIVHNKCYELGGGINFNQNSNPVVINNTIAFNQAGSGGGIDCRDDSDPKIINTIITGNTASDGNQVCLYVGNCDPHFYNCDIEGGLAGFGGPGSGDNYNGTYIDNIDQDPLFVDAAAGNYDLSDSSPCISGGIDSIQIGSTWYVAPATDFAGNARPNPAGSVPDIGACESVMGNYSDIQENRMPIAQSFQLYQNYPNPFNPVTTIHYNLTGCYEVQLDVYTLSGQRVATLVSENQTAGHYTVNWDASSGLASGVYIYQLKAGAEIQVRKMIYLK